MSMRARLRAMQRCIPPFCTCLLPNQHGRGSEAWGGLPELVVFCDEYRKKVSLFMHNTSYSVTPSTTTPDVKDPKKALLVAYVGQNHFDSIVPLDPSKKMKEPRGFSRTLAVETAEAMVCDPHSEANSWGKGTGAIRALRSMEGVIGSSRRRIAGNPSQVLGSRH